jgi:hypothetical protein
VFDPFSGISRSHLGLGSQSWASIPELRSSTEPFH